MLELVVVSGKGGTGKTSVTAALASSLATKTEHQVLVDCDVDAADLFLVLNPIKQETHVFKSGARASIDISHCTRCGACAQACRFDAISESFSVNSIKCEGCGVCSLVCRNDAISMQENIAGKWFVSETRFGPLIHAKLGVAQDNSGKLVAAIRTKAKEQASQTKAELILIDGPPGIGCPVISSISGASALLIVTEPSPSGIHDLKRLWQLAEHFKVKGMVCINKFDIHQGNTGAIKAFCLEHGLTVVGQIPYSTQMNEAQNRNQNIFELAETHGDAKGVVRHFVQLRDNIRNHLKMESV